MFDSTRVSAKAGSAGHNIILLLDYNDDRQLNSPLEDEEGDEKELKTLQEMEEYDNKDNDAMINIHTLGIHCCQL